MVQQIHGIIWRPHCSRIPAVPARPTWGLGRSGRLEGDLGPHRQSSCSEPLHRGSYLFGAWVNMCIIEQGIPPIPRESPLRIVVVPQNRQLCLVFLSVWGCSCSIQPNKQANKQTKQTNKDTNKKCLFFPAHRSGCPLLLNRKLCLVFLFLLGGFMFQPNKTGAFFCWFLFCFLGASQPLVRCWVSEPPSSVQSAFVKQERRRSCQRSPRRTKWGVGETSGAPSAP